MRHPKNYWKNKENVINESKKYTSRTDFKKKSNKAYEEAMQRARTNAKPGSLTAKANMVKDFNERNSR